uniref:hypothetical protein n=1 Tax=Escherichia coli TaxID=562 RepID=UPI002A59A21E|nr:hypothetical protein [Escherichia coli]
MALRRGSSVTTNTTNATEELSSLKIVEQEGYVGIEIHGPRLDMDTDFKVWVGITSALFDYAPDDDGIITCHFPSLPIDAAIHVSAFQKPSAKVLMTADAHSADGYQIPLPGGKRPSQ